MCDFVSFGNEITLLFGGVEDRETVKIFNVRTEEEDS